MEAQGIRAMLALFTSPFCINPCINQVTAKNRIDLSVQDMQKTTGLIMNKNRGTAEQKPDDDNAAQQIPDDSTKEDVVDRASIAVDSRRTDENLQENQDSTLSRLTNTVFIRSVSLTGIFIILLLHTIQIAAPILIPITLAWILSLLLAPLVRRMRKARIMEPIGAAIVLIAFLAITVSAIYGLSTPAQEWSERVPELVRTIDYRLRPLSEPLKQARDAAEQVSAVTDKVATPEDDTTGAEQKVTVTIEEQSWVTDLVSGTPQALANIGIVIVLMYFLLAGGDSFLNKLVSVTPKLRDKKRAVSIMRDIQSGISHYLLTCTIINTILGVVAAVAMYFLGMPNPVLWGALVGLLNFAPYIGPAMSLVVLTLVALLSFPTLGQALLVPLVVFGINILEGQLITPHIIGRRLALSPVVVFTSIVVWGWLWGIPGALMAIPIVAAFKVICERIDAFNPIADFISSAPRSER